jgi:hypothetical protein
MKRKGARDIPDFSALRKNLKPAAGVTRKEPDAPHSPPSQTAARNVKPAATSAKSGRRGQ